MRDVVLLILGAALGWLGQWVFYRYQRRDQQRQGPTVIVSKIQRADYTRAELRNVGPDTLTEMDVKFAWLDHGHRRELVVLDYYRGQDGPQRVEVVPSGETLEAAGIPNASDDGIVDVQVTGLGATSQHLYSTVSQIAVDLLKL